MKPLFKTSSLNLYMYTSMVLIQRRAISFLEEFIPTKKKGKNKNCRVASLESVLIHLFYGVLAFLSAIRLSGIIILGIIEWPVKLV